MGNLKGHNKMGRARLSLIILGVMISVFCLLTSVLCLLSSVPAAWAFGLEVDPVKIVIQDCPLGERAAVSALGGEEMKLKIQNKGPVAYTYVINILSSEETGALLPAGYQDIPSTSWLVPEEKEVKIAGNSAKEVELYLEIPEKEEYYNKRYQAIIEVKSKKNKPEEVFVLAVQIRMCFDTVRTPH